MRLFRIGIFVALIVIIILFIVKRNSENYVQHPLNFQYQLTKGYSHPDTAKQNDKNKSPFLIQKENYDTCNTHCK